MLNSLKRFKCCQIGVRDVACYSAQGEVLLVPATIAFSSLKIRHVKKKRKNKKKKKKNTQQKSTCCRMAPYTPGFDLACTVIILSLLVTMQTVQLLAPLVMQIFPVELLSTSLAIVLRLAVKAWRAFAGVKHSSSAIPSCRQTFFICNTFMQVV